MEIEGTEVSAEDMQTVLDAAMKVIPEGHLPSDAVLLVAHRAFEDDRTTNTYYSMIATPMAPHEMRGFLETMVERSAEIFGW